MSTYLSAFLQPLAMRGFFVGLFSSCTGEGGGVGDRSRYELQEEKHISCTTLPTICDFFHSRHFRLHMY